MSNYISLFGEHTEYTSYVRSEGFVMPNVSYCAVGKHVHFNPRVDWIDPEFKRVVLNAFNNGEESGRLCERLDFQEQRCD